MVWFDQGHVTRIHDCGILFSTQWNGCAFYHSFHHQALEPPNGPFCPQPTYTGCLERSPPSVFHFCTPFRLIKLLFYFHLFLPPFLWFHHSHPSVHMRSGSKCLCIRHSYSFSLSLFLYPSAWIVSDDAGFYCMWWAWQHISAELI